MNEPISFRPVTDLEEVKALGDGAYIVVIENGTAKRISKANANFGGSGSSVQSTFLLRRANDMAGSGAAGSTPTYTITHEDGSAITPQEMYDAFMSGPVILEEALNGNSTAEVILSMEYAGTPNNVTGCVVYTKNGNFTLG